MHRTLSALDVLYLQYCEVYEVLYITFSVYVLCIALNVETFNHHSFTV